ncbi:MAG: hypothetical protein HXX11_02935 [Desulfuromonadales bacterium]|nr:hypothetical protein [Desulfuromonadales bacterium]
MARDETLVDFVQPIKRLCGEIQLFELCDLECCNHKDGRFCTHSELLERFERIADEDDAVQNLAVHACDEEEEETDNYGEDDDFGDDGEIDTWEED